MKLDERRLGADLAALAREARALKVLLRARWVRPMADEQRRAARVRRKATELYVLRAWSRGRFHVMHLEEAERAAWHEAVAARVGRDYAPTEERRT